MDFYSGWYAAISSDEVKGNKPTAIRRFGRELVVWRDRDGKASVMDDSCPHRSVKLSLGSVKNGVLACAFHGFEFASDGSCILVPETGKPAANLRCRSMPCLESHGFIWLWYGPAEQAESHPPWFEELDEGLSWSQYTSSWPCHITRCIENQLDYAHLPYIHASTIGRGFKLQDNDRNFELDDDSIKLRLKQSHFIFKFPNIWSLQILPGRFYQFIAFVPIDLENTLLYVRAYQRFVTIPVLRNALALILDYQSKKILLQDKSVVISHPRQSSTIDVGEKLYPSDKGIVWFRKRWSEGTTEGFE
ncbi:MAG: aromatic ring-hydroxylating dioxygenase subunit alpha [Candidatus Obscuribacterales bacterium]|nr:aromatic ring-hydroxylating dioxygenase subunit alpha [Candidatus Obscuribacterales bacterium]